MLVKQRDKPAQRRLLGTVQPDCREVLGVTDPLRLFQLDRARHGPRLRLTRFWRGETPTCAPTGQAFRELPSSGRRALVESIRPARRLDRWVARNIRGVRPFSAKCRAAAKCPENAHFWRTAQALNISASNLGFNLLSA